MAIPQLSHPSILFLLLVCLMPVLAQADSPSAEAPETMPADGQVEGRELLRAQARAQLNTNYQGVLTYEHGAHLATMSIEHSIVEGQVRERLSHLSGEPRQVSFHREVCDGFGSRLLLGGVSGEGPDPDQSYHISVVGTERVAGRQVYLLQVMPRDQHRYGYVLGIDQESHLPLKLLLIGPGNQVLERFQYASISLGASTDVNEQQPVECQHRPSQWVPQWLPAGFSYAGSRQLESDRLMLMYTDGLSTFSLFIESAAAANLEGRAQRGATVAYLGRLDTRQGSYRVSAVGEVPVQTLERVALSLQKTNEGNASGRRPD